MGEQLNLLPKMDREAPGLFTASERIVQDFAKEKRVDATLSRISYKRCCTTLTLMMQFDPDYVDHYRHERLMGAI